MNSLINNSKLTAPGRMDVVQRVLKADPFFKSKMGGQSRQDRKNRRGIRKQYRELTVEVVTSLAKSGLDAAKMRRDEIIAKAFEYCELNSQQAVAA